MMLFQETRARRFMGDVLAATFLLWLPLLVFLRHNSYPLVSSEVGILLAIQAAAGIFWGAAMSAGRTPVRVAVITLLAILVVDAQTDWITTWGLRLLLNIVVFGVVAWLLRRRLPGAVIVLAGLMIAGTILTPAGTKVRRDGTKPDQESVRDDLPFVLHVILDEHIGIEGVPAEFDPDGEVAGWLRDDYVGRGFTVFGRAYSRYYNTEESLGNVLNFTASPTYQRYFPPNFRRGALLDQNAWFEVLQNRGYRIQVFQTDFVRFHRVEAATDNRLADGSVTIPGETVGALARLDLPANEKARFILGSYQRLSFFQGLIRQSYRKLRTAGLPLPDWDDSGDRLSTLSSLQSLDDLQIELKGAGPGHAFFVHLLIPHYPYAYRADCRPRPMSGTWLNADDHSLLPRRNDDVSRANRYPLYLEQLACVHGRVMELLDGLAAHSWWDQAIVVVHGDHGSRIDRGPPMVPTVEEMEPQDFLDAFSTLYVVKSPVLPSGYDRRQLPLDHLSARILRDGVDPGDETLQEQPWVWIRNGIDPMLPWSIPFFENGRPDTTRPGPLEP